MRVEDLYATMTDLARKGTPFVTATVIEAKGSSPRGVGTKMLVLKDGTTVDTIGGGALEQRVVADAADSLAAGASRTAHYELRTEGEHALGAVCGGEVTVFLEVHLPERTLVIVGAGHVGQSLCRCAKLLDRRVVVVDPREDMVTAARLPEADQLVCAEPGHLAELEAIGESTEIVILTHSHVLDEAALRAAIGTPAAYVGMIGSAKKVQTVFSRLKEDGVSAEQLERVHAPIGLDIGAETPAELALCIMAEIVATANGKDERQAVRAKGSQGGASA